MSEEIENVENNERPNEKDIQQVLRTFCEQEQIINLPDPIDAGKAAEIYAAKNGLSLGYQQEVAKEANAQGGYSDNEVTPDNNLNYGLDSGINPEGFNININALVDLSDGLQPEEKLRILLHIKELQEQKKAEEARAETREQVVQARLKTNNSIFTERDAEFFKINGGGELSKGIYSLGLSDYAQSLIDRPASQASKDFLASLEKENVELKGDTNKEKLLNYTVQRFKELGFDDKILKSGTAEIENISFGSVDRKRTKANEVSSQFVVAHKNNNPDFFNNFAMWQSEVKAHQGMEELFNMNGNVAAQPSVAKQSVNNDFIGISSLNEPLSTEAGKTGRKEPKVSDEEKVKKDNINKIINAIENSKMSVDEYETLKNNNLPSDLMILALGNNKIRSEMIENPDKYNGSQEQKWANVLLNNKDVALAYNNAIGKQEESLAMELKARQGMEELFSNANENPIYEAANAAPNRTGYGAPAGLRPATEEELAALHGSNQSASNVKIPADRSMLTKLDHKIFATKDFNKSLGFRDEFILFMKNDDSYNKQQRALLVSAMEEEGYHLNGNDRQKLLQYARIRFKDFGFKDTVVPDDVSMSDIQFVEAKFNNSKDRLDFAQAMYKVTKGEKVAIPNLSVTFGEEVDKKSTQVTARENSLRFKEQTGLRDKQETGLMDKGSNDTAAEPVQEEAAPDKSISDEEAPKGLRPATADELKRADSAPEPTAASEEADPKKDEPKKEEKSADVDHSTEKEATVEDVTGQRKGGKEGDVAQTEGGKKEWNVGKGTEDIDEKEFSPTTDIDNEYQPFEIQGGQDAGDVILNNAMKAFSFVNDWLFHYGRTTRQQNREKAKQAQQYLIGEKDSLYGQEGMHTALQKAIKAGKFDKVDKLLDYSENALAFAANSMSKQGTEAAKQRMENMRKLNSAMKECEKQKGKDSDDYKAMEKLQIQQLTEWRKAIAKASVPIENYKIKEKDLNDDATAASGKSAKDVGELTPYQKITNYTMKYLGKEATENMVACETLTERAKNKWSNWNDNRQEKKQQRTQQQTPSNVQVAQQGRNTR